MIKIHTHITLILYKWRIESTYFRDRDQERGATLLSQMPSGHYLTHLTHASYVCCPLSIVEKQTTTQSKTTSSRYNWQQSKVALLLFFNICEYVSRMFILSWFKVSSLIWQNLKGLVFFYFILLYIYIYDRNSNINSHTCIFWRSLESNPHPHRGVRLFGEEDYHWAEYPRGKGLV